MKMNKWLLIGVAVFGLAMVSFNVSAQERNRTVTLTNTAFGTAYYALGGSNVVDDSGQVTYQGGTNNNTGNMMAGMTVSNNYQGASGQPFRVSEMQNGQVVWFLAAHSITNSTYPTASVASNSTYQLDLSPTADQSFWISNALSASVTQGGLNTNSTVTVYQYQNGTNAFTGYYWGRWSGFNSSATNPVVTDRNQLTQFR